MVGDGTYHWFGLTNEVVAGPSASTLTVGDTTDSTFTGNITGPTALTKQGNGKLVLGGSNSFTGATTITAGTLLVNGALTDTTSVAVNGGTLGGTGTINPAATLSIATGATVAPGASIGTLSTGSVAFADGSTLSIELGVSTADQLLVIGGTNIAGTVNLGLTLLDDPLEGTYFTLIDGTAPFTGYDGGARFSYLGNSLDEGETFTVNSGLYSQEFLITYLGDGGKDVKLQATPEPGSAALLLLGGVAFLRRRRRD
jgi:autotransporter-associated beta strand protein